MTGDTEQEIVSAVAKKAEVSEDEVEDRIDEKVEELREHQASELPEEELRKHAVNIVKSDLLNMTGGSGFGGGDAEKIPILTLGYQMKEADYFVTDGDALLASGIINPAEAPAGYAVFIIDEAHGIDLEHAEDAFQPLNTVRGNVSKRRVGSRDGEPSIKKGGNPTYLVNSTSESTFEIVDPNEVSDDDPISELPAEREPKRNLIHNNFITEEDTVTLQTYAEHKSAVNDNGYPVAFGVDVKRVRGEVIDSYVFESGDGVMTITDDTIFDQDDVPEDLVADNQRTPGLQISIGGNLVVGENSVVDLYGHIVQQDDGQYKMQALGMIPVIEFDYEGPDNSGSSTDDAATEDTI